MYDPYIVRRTQIYLDEEQAERLDRRARAAGVTRSTLIREAIDRVLAESDADDARLDRYREAVDKTFGRIRRLPSGAEHVDELRRGDAARLSRPENDGE